LKASTEGDARSFVFGAQTNADEGQSTAELQEKLVIGDIDVFVGTQRPWLTRGTTVTTLAAGDDSDSPEPV
jgi:hypothetical protein